MMNTRDATAAAAEGILEALIRVEAERLSTERAEPEQIGSADRDKREWMTDVEVAEYLRVSVETLQDWRRPGRVRVLPFHRLGRRVLYDRAEIDAALDASRVDP